MNGDVSDPADAREPSGSPGKRPPSMADVRHHTRSLQWQKKTSKIFPESGHRPSGRPGYTFLETCTAVAECGMLRRLCGRPASGFPVTSVLRVALAAVPVPDGS